MMEIVGVPASPLPASYGTSETVVPMDEERNDIGSRVAQRLDFSSGRPDSEKASVKGRWGPLSGHDHRLEDHVRIGSTIPEAGFSGSNTTRFRHGSRGVLLTWYP